MQHIVKHDSESAVADQEPLIDRLRSEDGETTRQRIRDALDRLQAKLKASEQRGVPPHIAKALSAAQLAVKSARDTIDSVQVGRAAGSQ